MPTTRRQFLEALGGLAIAPLLWSCRTTEPLCLAAHVWPGYELMFLARREGWLRERQVSFVETASASDSLDAIRSGKVHGAALTLDEVLRARAEGIPLTVVLVFDISAGADCVVAGPHLQAITELRGKRIGLEEGALGALILSKVLARAGIKPGDITIVPVTSDRHVSAWQEGRCDALITYEPMATRICKLGGHRIFDSRDLPDTIFDVLAIRRDLLKKYAPNIRDTVAGHFRALQHLTHNRGDATHRMAGRLRLDVNEVLDIFRGLNLPDSDENRKLLSGPHNTVLAAAGDLSRTMLKAGMLPKGDSLAGLTSSDFLPTPGLK